jgi:hypothetical protein
VRPNLRLADGWRGVPHSSPACFSSSHRAARRRAVLADLRPAERGRGLARAGAHLARRRAVAGDVLEARGADEGRDRRTREPVGLDGVRGWAGAPGRRTASWRRADRDDPGCAAAGPVGVLRRRGREQRPGCSCVPCCSSRSALCFDTVESGKGRTTLGKGQA